MNGDPAPKSSARATADHVARASYGRLVALLATRSGDIAGAEDALADAFHAALVTWPRDGVPARPEAWILTVARNRRTDAHRRAARIGVGDPLPDLPDIETPAGEFPDQRLGLMFVCAHPAIDPGIHTPLMLQAVLGVEAIDIARAFLVSPTAMAQRLVRAKAKIKAARIPFAAPGIDLLPERLEPVLEAIYGAYALDWMQPGDALGDEALYLASLLADLAPDQPEALGLAALIGFSHARRDARLRDGVLVPLHEQETALWDAQACARASALLDKASRLGRIGRFQIEAAIQSVHAARLATGRTDWRALARLHAGLAQIYPTLGGAVAQAAAVGEDAGPEQGLAALDRIRTEDIAGFQPAWAVRAHLLARRGRINEAAEAYDKAISLATDAPTRRWLETRREALRPPRV